MRALDRRLKLRLGLALALTGAAILGGHVAWKALVVPRFTAAVERLSGHRMTVGGLTLWGRTLVAHDVRLYGAPPFESEPLLRAAELSVRLGGPTGWLVPAEVSGDGVEIDYLAHGTSDNVRGARAAAGGARGAGRALPAIRFSNARVRGAIQPGTGPRLTFRARALSVSRRSSGAVDLSVAGLTLDAREALTASVERLTLASETPGTLLVRGGGGVVAVPGGGPLIDGLMVEGFWSSRERRVTVTRTATPGTGPVRIDLRVEDAAAHLTVDARELALAPLSALTGPYGWHLTGARTDLHLLATLPADGDEVPFQADLHARGVDLHGPAVDRTPWHGLDLQAHASGAVERAGPRLRVDSGEVRALGARLAISGFTELTETPRAQITVQTPPSTPLPCTALWAGQPGPVKQAIEGLRVGGDLGLRVAVSLDAVAWEALSLEVQVVPLCRVLAEPTALSTLLPTLQQGAAPPPGTRTDRALGRYHPDFVPLAQMPAHLPAAFLTAEDGGFFRHRGFDLEMIRRALAHDLETRSFAKGASTVTQQLAKNLFLTHDRTVGRKLTETVIAWRIDQLVSKERQLELYLNVIELGPGIRGVKQAARAYFGKEVSALRPIESAHLAALTPNPHALARRFRDGRVDDGWLQRLYDLLAMMKRSGRLSSSEISAARVGTLTLRKI